METSRIGNNIRIQGDLEVILDYNTLGRFLDTDHMLFHLRAAHINKRLVEPNGDGQIKINYDSQNKHHLVPVDVEMTMQRTGSVEEVVTMYLSPVESQFEQSRGEILRIRTNLENFLRGPQRYTAPLDYIKVRTPPHIAATNP